MAAAPSTLDYATQQPDPEGNVTYVWNFSSSSTFPSLAFVAPTATLAPTGRELVLHDLPKLRIEDGLVLARVGGPLVNNIAPIEPVLQHQVEGAAGEPVTAGQPSAGSLTALAHNILPVEFALSSATDPNSA